MNDYWNDPPEEPEIPECCEEEMDVDNDGNCKCLKCGATIDAFLEPMEPMEGEWERFPADDEMPPEDDKCPHGNKWGDCGPCDYASDIAYDAARENRLR